MSKRWWVGIGLVLAAALLSGCGTTAWTPRPVPFADSGSELRVLRALEFPAGTTRIYFQHGRPITQRQLTVWEQHCALAIDHAFDETIRLEPGALTVARTQRNSSFGDWGRGVATYNSNFYFAPSAYPVYALYCEIWTLGGGYNYGAHITPRELDQVLGEWLDLIPVEGGKGK